MKTVVYKANSRGLPQLKWVVLVVELPIGGVFVARCFGFCLPGVFLLVRGGRGATLCFGEVELRRSRGLCIYRLKYRKSPLSIVHFVLWRNPLLKLCPA